MATVPVIPPTFKVAPPVVSSIGASPLKTYAPSKLDHNNIPRQSKGLTEKEHKAQQKAQAAADVEASKTPQQRHREEQVKSGQRTDAVRGINAAVQTVHASLRDVHEVFSGKYSQGGGVGSEIQSLPELSSTYRPPVAEAALRRPSVQSDALRSLAGTPSGGRLEDSMSGPGQLSSFIPPTVGSPVQNPPTPASRRMAQGAEEFAINSDRAYTR